MPHTGVCLRVCPYPVTFDTYRGCSHNCRYCFINYRAGGKKTGEENVRAGEPIKALEKWCRGERSRRESWCDWDIPLCFGRNSDPFQPIEREKKLSLAALKVFAKHGYPFIMTTKGVMAAFEPEYKAVLKDCNVCWQQTMCSPLYDKLEPNAPPYEKRLEAIGILSGIVPRVIVRWQPAFFELAESMLAQLKAVKAAGAHGVLVETANLLKPRGMCKVRNGRLYDYDPEDKMALYVAVMIKCKEHGLAYFNGDYKELSDSVECCGCGGMSGFVPNYCNSTYYFLDREHFAVRPHMKEIGTGEVFQNVFSGRIKYQTLEQSTFEAMMKTAIRKIGEVSREGGD